jgi:pimeloyl-ACP methyl ester carboxylesterase
MPEIEITDATLHYVISGNGQPILLIPGLGMDHSYYRLGVPLLTQRLQVIASILAASAARPSRRRLTRSKAGPTISPS